MSVLVKFGFHAMSNEPLCSGGAYKQRWERNRAARDYVNRQMRKSVVSMFMYVLNILKLSKERVMKMFAKNRTSVQGFGGCYDES